MYRWENDPEVWAVSGTTAPFSRHMLVQFVEQQRLDLAQTRQQFVTGIVSNQYNALQMTILNRSEGQVDTLRLRFSDLLGEPEMRRYLPFMFKTKFIFRFSGIIID